MIFDPKGIYIRKWLPELEHLELEQLHEPWTLCEKTEDQKGYFNLTYPKEISIPYDPEKDDFLNEWRSGLNLTGKTD
jgi:deoxyribodipyrimidine photolyase